MRHFGKLCVAVVCWYFASAHLDAATIVKMSLWNIVDVPDTYVPSNSNEGLIGPGFPQTYFLDDGTSWQSGAGSFQTGELAPTSVSAAAGVISYLLQPINGSPIALNFTDYDSGNHSAQGVFEFASPLILTANQGSNVATLSGYLLLFSNDATYYGEPRFNYFDATVGSIVPFTVEYTLQSGTWTSTTFDSTFLYSTAGEIDFASVPEPASCGMIAFTLPAIVLVCRRRNLKRVRPAKML